MQYRHAPAADHGDLDAVLVSAPGRPTLPVRLTLELFGRALAHVGPGPVTVWDPCCGAGTTLAVLGLCRGGDLSGLIATDVDPAPLELARRNLALLDPGGLDARASDLDALAVRHGKPGYADAAAAARRMAAPVVPYEVATTDATDPAATRPVVERHRPQIVIADLPHGVQTQWSGGEHVATELVSALAPMLAPDAVIAVAGRGRKITLPAVTGSVERFRVGHRAAALVRAGDVGATA